MYFTMSSNLKYIIVTARDALPSSPPRLFSVNHSLFSFAFLALAVLLFDVLGGIYLTKAQEEREMLLPGFGLLGDAFNNLAEVALNALTIYLYR